MSQRHHPRRLAAVGLGSLALTLAAGPAFALDPVPAVDTAVASVSAPLEPVLNVVEPVVKAVAPPAPAPAPRPAAVTDPITAIVAAVVKQVDKITAVPKAAAPTAPTGPSSSVTQAAAPVAQAPAAAPLEEVRGNALTAAVIALGSRVDSGNSAAPLAFSPLGGLARGMAAGLPPLASGTTEFSPTLALPGVSPPAVVQDILPVGSSPAGPTSLPGVLVALAVMAVAVTAAGHVSEAQRRRPASTA